MSEQLGRIEKPEAERFKRGKKLYLVPLIYSGDDAPEEYRERHSRYWRQVEEQLDNLASKIGRINRVYHESIFQSGEEGLQAVQRLNPDSYRIARNQCDKDAAFETIEDKELLEEVMDWQRCLMIGLVSERVGKIVLDFYLEAGRKRNELIVKRLGETLKDDEAGVLFIRDGHSVQFPTDIEVFSVVPPALDEIHRWFRDQASAGTRETAREQQRKTESEGAEGARKPPKKKRGKTGQ